MHTPVAMTNPEHAVRAVLREAGITKPARLHDLRRTVATKLGELGFSIGVAAAVLNHRVPGGGAWTFGYFRPGQDREKRQALEAWARRLEEIVSKRRRKGAAVLAISAGRP
jgi:hypothetical protein